MSEIIIKNIPRHVAIIMDGNGRWAENRELPRSKGHTHGVSSAREIVRYAVKLGIEVLTLFAFGRENWRRPAEEVEIILGLFLTALASEIDELHENNVILKVIGNQSHFSKDLQQQIAYTENLTSHNSGLILAIAADYSGQWDITEAVKKIVQRVLNGELTASAIDSDLMNAHLELSGLPHPDLFIRTSGEQRISNFYLWQLAYTELYFTPVHWPDFDEKEFAKALAFYASRKRRYGYTNDQICASEMKEQ